MWTLDLRSEGKGHSSQAEPLTWTRQLVGAAASSTDRRSDACGQTLIGRICCALLDYYCLGACVLVPCHTVYAPSQPDRPSATNKFRYDWCSGLDSGWGADVADVVQPPNTWYIYIWSRNGSIYVLRIRSIREPCPWEWEEQLPHI